MFSLLPALVAVYFLFAGYYVYSQHNRLDRSHIAFLILCVTTFVWQSTWAVLFQVNDPELSSLLVNLGYLLIIFLPTSLYQLLVEISQSTDERRYVYLSYALSSVLAITLLTTDLFVTGYYEYYWGHYPKAGPLHPIHVLQTTVVVMRGLFLTFKREKVADEPQRSILRCCKISVFVYFLAAVDYLCNYGFEFYPPGIIFVATSLTIIGYAMVRKDLFDIRVVISRTAAQIIVGGLIALCFVIINGFQSLSLTVMVISNTFVALIWAKYADRMCKALQTATEKKWISDWYDLDDILNKLTENLYGLLEKKAIIQEVANILKQSMAVKDVHILVRNNHGFSTLGDDHYFEKKYDKIISFLSNQSGESFLFRQILPSINEQGVVMVLRSSQRIEGIILLQSRLSNNPYTSADNKLLTTISRQINVFLDRANAYELKIKAVKSLAGTIAHEMRNPLSQIYGSLYMIEQQLPQLSHNEYVKGAHQVIQNGLQVIDITMDAINEKPINKENFKIISAQNLVADVLREYAYKDDMHKDKVSAREGDFSFLADAVLVKYVLFNLIGNALYYVKTLPDSEIVISLCSESHQIEVRDTGPGIEPEAIPKLFDGFYTSGKQGGTGLGLAYCKRTMKALGGDIRCESELGEYTAFVLTFPKASTELKTVALSL